MNLSNSHRSSLTQSLLFAIIQLSLTPPFSQTSLSRSVLRTQSFTPGLSFDLPVKFSSIFSLQLYHFLTLSVFLTLDQSIQLWQVLPHTPSLSRHHSLIFLQLPLFSHSFCLTCCQSVDQTSTNIPSLSEALCPKALNPINDHDFERRKTHISLQTHPRNPLLWRTPCDRGHLNTSGFICYTNIFIQYYEKPVLVEFIFSFPV